MLGRIQALDGGGDHGSVIRCNLAGQLHLRCPWRGLHRLQVKLLREGIDRKANGIISLVVPLVNIAAAVIFGLALLASTALGFGDIVIGHSFYFLQEGVQINLVLGAFNMIPFFILDGQKVFTWDRRVWAAVAIPLWIAVAVSVLRVF